ncbi:methyl-accepting chemotaxis protein [Alteromonas aestuariivivens]|uniref:Methyl-accepting chemotaxis protein n=1 Tax=Alteromonas aestuariivivens TaxID=1938339 RepID=A0A3D8MBF3_9ALTE|nr:methyl-accepting chemotaxis protein [Alteromonas aestuariivivens]RDV26742.1 methyl-accepting chemotaxis protein [Alteromonas aestuariivivens]
MNFNAFSIKQKLIACLLLAVLASTLLVGTISQWIARDFVEQNLENSELPAILAQVANRVDKEASVMKAVAHSIATNPDFVSWVTNGAPQQGETRLVGYLNEAVEYNDLTVASFVDRKTHKYWNQDGFLRVLEPGKLDNWFFDYKNSGETVSLSLYNEPGEGFRLFANYQQLNGRGMSGVAKSVDELVSIINSVKIGTDGKVFLLDSSGTVIAHPEVEKVGNTRLSDLMGQEGAYGLTQEASFQLAKVTLEGQAQWFASSYIPSADWYVVAQVYEQQLYVKLNSASNHMVMWSLVIAALFAFVGIWLASGITRPIERLASAFQDLGRGQGDLTRRIPPSGQPETAMLVDGFNSFIASLHGIISSVAQTSSQLRESAFQVAQQSHTTEDNSQIQRDSTAQVATALTEMGTTVGEIAGSAQEAANSARVASEASHQGRQLASEAVGAISTLNQQINTISTVIGTLNQHSSAIGSILDTIRSISEQTNLLALNAAIEAARAGEHGRGFSVVADEVRNLAQRAASATDEIQSMLNEFQQESRLAVKEMEVSQEQTAKVAEVTGQIDHALNTIDKDINRIDEVNTQVATATEQQAKVVEDINKNIHEISMNSEGNLTTASELVAVSRQLEQLAQDLAGQVGRFNL